jgi:small conductance mechanosensitive channel
MAAMSDLVGKLFEKLQGWMTEFVVLIPNLLLALVVVGVAWFAAKGIRKGIYRTVHRLTDNVPISGLLGTMARVGVVGVSLFFALGLVGLDKTVTSLLAGLGVVGLALGFAFQDIAANFMSGFMMALRRPFDVGDLVEVADHKAKVNRITLRATELETLDGLSVLIPNKDIFQGAITNFTRTATRRLDVRVGVAYGDDLERVQRVIQGAIEGLENRLADRDAEVFFDEFGDSSINFTVRVWLAQSDERTYRHTRSQAIIAIKKAFDANGITIPFPIRTLDFGAGVVGGERIDAMNLHVASAARTGT